MKYCVSHLCNTGKALNYKIRNEAKREQETVFSFSRDLVRTWGNPKPPLLKEVMVADVKRHGWSNDPVSLDDKNTPRSLRNFIAGLPKKKA